MYRPTIFEFRAHTLRDIQYNMRFNSGEINYDTHPEPIFSPYSIPFFFIYSDLLQNIN